MRPGEGPAPKTGHGDGEERLVRERFDGWRRELPDGNCPESCYGSARTAATASELIP